MKVVLAGAYGNLGADIFRSLVKEGHEVVALDKQYIENWSLWLDLKILVKTVKVVLRHEGAS